MPSSAKRGVERAVTSTSGESGGAKPSDDETAPINNKSTRKRTRKRKPKQRGNDDLEHDFEAEQLRKRFVKNGTTRKQAEDAKIAPYLRKVVAEDGTGIQYQLHNPASHSRMIERIELNDFKPAAPPKNIVPSPWLCALCGVRTCREDLGDLFGPYYYELPASTSSVKWPPNLKRKLTVVIPDEPTAATQSQKRRRSGTKDLVAVVSPKRQRPRAGAAIKTANSPKQTAKTVQQDNVDQPSSPKSKHVAGESAELWFHGDCVLWADGIFLQGATLVGLQQLMPIYWKTKCTHCNRVGASVKCTRSGCHTVYHYPCALKQGSLRDLSALELECCCPLHD